MKMSRRILTLPSVVLGGKCTETGKYMEKNDFKASRPGD